MPSVKRRAANRAAGFCPDCGKPAKPGRVSCQQCIDRAREKGKFYQASGLCHCGGQRAPGRRNCQKCLDRAKAHRRISKMLHENA